MSLPLLAAHRERWPISSAAATRSVRPHAPVTHVISVRQTTEEESKYHPTKVYIDRYIKNMLVNMHIEGKGASSFLCDFRHLGFVFTAPIGGRQDSATVN